MKKRLSGFKEAEFPEETETAAEKAKGGSRQSNNRKSGDSKGTSGLKAREPERSSAEQRKVDRKNSKKQVVKDIVILALFLVAAFTAVILINRYFPKNAESGSEEGHTDSTDRLVADGSSAETVPKTEPEIPTDAVTLPPTETELQTEPPTEPPTEPQTEPPTEPPTVPPTVPETPEPTVAPSTAWDGTEPRMYPYRELQPGLTIPVQGGITMPSWITQDLLRPGADSRPGTAIGTIKHVVIHYVGNVGSSAKDNRDYFEGNVDGRKVSSHFVVGMYGEIIQCIPLNEVAYAQGVSRTYMDQGMVNHNYDAISIENCHPYSNGQFTTETYWALVKLSAWLLEQYGLGTDALMRHYDATTNAALGVHGKGCPLYFVEHPEAWEQFKNAVGQYMIEHPNIQ